MTDKAKILAEIERQKKIYMYDTSKHSFGRMIQCNDLLVFINSLPEEPVSEDLEEAANNYAELLPQGRIAKKYCKIDFKAGARWQKDKLTAWLTREADYLIQELQKGNKAYGLSEQYRAQLYKEIVNKIKDD